MIDSDQIATFLEGKSEDKYIISVEGKKVENFVYVIRNDPDKGKIVTKERYKPFIWCKKLDGDKFYKGNRSEMVKAMATFGIKYKALVTKLNPEDEEQDRIINGYKFILSSDISLMSIELFLKKGGIEPRGGDRENFIILSPQEQFMIQSGKRLYKGFEDYNDLHRVIFDIETTGIDSNKDRIIKIGIKDNKGFQHIIHIDKDINDTETKAIRDKERLGIVQFFKLIDALKPDLIIGYNSENFDWSFILNRCEILNIRYQNFAKGLNGDSLYRSFATLKIGAETENYSQTNLWGYNIVDASHSVRRSQAQDSNIKSWGLKYITKFSKVVKKNRVYVKGGDISKISEDKITQYVFRDIDGSYEEFTKDYELKDGEEIVSGSYIVERYLIDDLWETQEVDYKFNQSNFLLSKIIPTTYSRVTTMGTAAVWKIIMLAWSYENNMAIPALMQQRSIVGGLSRVLKLGYSENLYKLDFASLYPSLMLTYDIFPKVDLSGALKGILTYTYNIRNHHKALELEAELNGDESSKMFYNKKQIPIKILNNGLFGSLSAANMFYWGDYDMGELITCSGRQQLRSMIKFFMTKDLSPTIVDTDGVNFIVPKDFVYNYKSSGKHRFTELDKVYNGVEAVVAEFNDNYMNGVMGLDIDELIDKTINVSRKNYINMKKNKIKVTGNSIKSKKLPKYIENLFDEGFQLLMTGNGYDFVEIYYDLVDKIYNRTVPVRDIASKSRVRISLDDYKKKMLGKNKNGGALAKQAHMELLLLENLDMDLGSDVFYINTGIKKSHGDIKTIKKENTSTVEFNCTLLIDEVMNNTTALDIQYNVEKYIDMLNKKVKPLLVAFSLETRNKILVLNPQNRNYFTRKELDLVSGIPFKKEDQDLIEELLTISDREIEFWVRTKLDSEYMFIKN